MYKEKHTLKNHYGRHKLSRYVDVYETSTINCSANKLTGYAGDNVTVTSTPAWNQKFSGYSITGSTLTGTDFKFVNSDVTVEANYETAKNLTLQTDGHGTIAANKMSGFIGDQVTLSNTPAARYEFSAYTLTGANLTGNKFNFTGSDVTAKAWFNYLGPSANVKYSLGDDIYMVDYLSAHDSFDHPTWINGVINFGSSGSNFGSDRYFGIKYDTRVACINDTANLPIVLNTTLDLNDSKARINIVDTGTSFEHIIHPGYTRISYNYSQFSDTATFYAQRWALDGNMTGSFTALFAYQDSGFYADANQNALLADVYVTPTYNGWVENPRGCSWTARDAILHKFIFDKQSCSYSAFIAGTCRAKFVHSVPAYVGTTITSINKLTLVNAQNSKGAIFNLQLASFSNIADALDWQ